MSDKLNAQELADRYGIRRDQMENLIKEISVRPISVDGESRFDNVEVERLLRQRDAHEATEALAALDSFDDDELALEILDEILEKLRKQWGAVYSGANEAAIRQARGTLERRLSTGGHWMIRRLRQERSSARTPTEEATVERQLVRAYQGFRDNLLRILAEHRAAHPETSKEPPAT